MPPHAPKTGLHELRGILFSLEPQGEDLVMGIIPDHGALREGRQTVHQVPAEIPGQGRRQGIPPDLPPLRPGQPQGIQQMGPDQQPGLGDDQIELSHVLDGISL